MRGLRFVRRVDGLADVFVRDGELDGYPDYKRIDDDVWCRRLPDFGWAVCDGSGAVSARPFEDAGAGDVPPVGVLVSYKGNRSYVYDMVQVDDA